MCRKCKYACTFPVPPVCLRCTSCIPLAKPMVLTLTYPTAVSASSMHVIKKSFLYVYAVLGMLPCLICTTRKLLWHLISVASFCSVNSFLGSVIALLWPPYLLSVVLIVANNHNISGLIGYSVPLKIPYQPWKCQTNQTRGGRTVNP